MIYVYGLFDVFDVCVVLFVWVGFDGMVCIDYLVLCEVLFEWLVDMFVEYFDFDVLYVEFC